MCMWQQTRSLPFLLLQVKSQANSIAKAKQTARGEPAPLKRWEQVLLSWEFKGFLILRNHCPFQNKPTKKQILTLSIRRIHFENRKGGKRKMLKMSAVQKAACLLPCHLKTSLYFQWTFLIYSDLDCNILFFERWTEGFNFCKLQRNTIYFHNFVSSFLCWIPFW